jgi:hypothetical protein
MVNFQTDTMKGSNNKAKEVLHEILDFFYHRNSYDFGLAMA